MAKTSAPTRTISLKQYQKERHVKAWEKALSKVPGTKYYKSTAIVTKPSGKVVERTQVGSGDERVITEREVVQPIQKVAESLKGVIAPKQGEGAAVIITQMSGGQPTKSFVYDVTKGFGDAKGIGTFAGGLPDKPGQKVMGIAPKTTVVQTGPAATEAKKSFVVEYDVIKPAEETKTVGERLVPKIIPPSSKETFLPTTKTPIEKDVVGDVFVKGGALQEMMRMQGGVERAAKLSTISRKEAEGLMPTPQERKDIENLKVEPSSFLDKFYPNKKKNEFELWQKTEYTKERMSKINEKEQQIEQEGKKLTSDILEFNEKVKEIKKQKEELDKLRTEPRVSDIYERQRDEAYAKHVDAAERGDRNQADLYWKDVERNQALYEESFNAEKKTFDDYNKNLAILENKTLNVNAKMSELEMYEQDLKDLYDEKTGLMKTYNKAIEDILGKDILKKTEELILDSSAPGVMKKDAMFFLGGTEFLRDVTNVPFEYGREVRKAFDKSKEEGIGSLAFQLPLLKETIMADKGYNAPKEFYSEDYWNKFSDIVGKGETIKGPVISRPDDIWYRTTSSFDPVTTKGAVDISLMLAGPTLFTKAGAWAEGMLGKMPVFQYPGSKVIPSIAEKTAKGIPLSVSEKVTSAVRPAAFAIKKVAPWTAGAGIVYGGDIRELSRAIGKGDWEGAERAGYGFAKTTGSLAAFLATADIARGEAGTFPIFTKDIYLEEGGMEPVWKGTTLQWRSGGGRGGTLAYVGRGLDPYKIGGRNVPRFVAGGIPKIEFAGTQYLKYVDVGGTKYPIFGDTVNIDGKNYPVIENVVYYKGQILDVNRGGYSPTTKGEYDILKKNLKDRPDLMSEEKYNALFNPKYGAYGTMKGTYRIEGGQIDKFMKNTRAMPDEATVDVINIIDKYGGTIFGSFSARPQIEGATWTKHKGSGVEGYPGDADAQFFINYKRGIEIADEIINVLQKRGVEARRTGTLVETKNPETGEWVHAVDIKTIDNPEVSEISTYGMRFPGTKTKLDDTFSLTLGEQGLRTGASVFTLTSDAEGKMMFEPKLHRVKDIESYFMVQEQLGKKLPESQQKAFFEGLNKQMKAFDYIPKGDVSLKMQLSGDKSPQADYWFLQKLLGRVSSDVGTSPRMSDSYFVNKYLSGISSYDLPSKISLPGSLSEIPSELPSSLGYSSISEIPSISDYPSDFSYSYSLPSPSQIPSPSELPSPSQSPSPSMSPYGFGFIMPGMAGATGFGGTGALPSGKGKLGKGRGIKTWTVTNPFRDLAKEWREGIDWKMQDVNKFIKMKPF